MVWIVIALVLIVAIGPVLMLKPSRASRRQAALRTAARRAGLVVEVADVPKIDADPAERVSAGGVPREARIDCVVYRLPFPARLANAPRWMLLKSAQENRFLDGWATLTPPEGIPFEGTTYWRQIKTIVDAMPGGCVAVEAGARMVAWYGRERIGEYEPDELVEAIRAGLVDLADMHARFETTAESGDC